MYFSAAPSSENDQGHEFGLENGPAFRNDAVEGSPHPADHRVADSALDILEGPPRVALEPVTIEGFGDDAELDYEVSGEISGLNFPPLLFP
jgi:hypothetical protein